MMTDIILTKRELEDPRQPHIKGVWNDERQLALRVMDEQGHNVAHFGINGCFLFSKFDKSLEVMQ